MQQGGKHVFGASSMRALIAVGVFVAIFAAADARAEAVTDEQVAARHGLSVAEVHRLHLYRNLTNEALMEMSAERVGNVLWRLDNPRPNQPLGAAQYRLLQQTGSEDEPVPENAFGEAIAQQAQENRQAPIADLNEVLEAIRAELEELSSATGTVAERRKEAEALKQKSERLAAELEQASSRRTELEDWRKRAEARIAALSNSVVVADRKAARLDKELAGARRQIAGLEEGLARADSARKAAEANAEKTRTEMGAKLEAATDAAEQSRAELARLREELATAKRARQQTQARVVARVSEMEQAVERSGAEAERLKSELAEVKEQLGQAATAAVEAERARQVASSEADLLRGEAARAREDVMEALRLARAYTKKLTGAQSEIERFKTANTELEKQIASLHTHSKSATETARQTLIMMEEKIEELNAALVGAGRAETTPIQSPPANPDSVADERSTGGIDLRRHPGPPLRGNVGKDGARD